MTHRSRPRDGMASAALPLALLAAVLGAPARAGAAAEVPETALDTTGCIAASATAAACIVEETIIEADMDLGTEQSLYLVPFLTPGETTFVADVACESEDEEICEVDRPKALAALRSGGFRPLAAAPVALAAGRAAAVGATEVRVKRSGDVVVKGSGDRKRRKVDRLQGLQKLDFPLMAAVVPAEGDAPSRLLIVTAAWPDWDPSAQDSESPRVRLLTLGGPKPPAAPRPKDR